MQTAGNLSASPIEGLNGLDDQSRLLLSLAGARIVSESTEVLASEVEFLRSVMEQLPAQIFVKDTQSRFVFANQSTVANLGEKHLDTVRGRTDFAFYSPQNAQTFYDREQQIMRSGVAEVDYEEKYVGPDGLPAWHLSSKIPLRNSAGEVTGILGFSLDITERKRHEMLRRGQSDLLEMIARSEPLPAILEALVLLIESQLAGIYGSILLLDETGRHLFKGAAPNLPDAYNAQIDGVAIGNLVGSCGTAAWSGKPVIVSDIMTDPHWENFRGLAAAFGFRSCWSTPIIAQQAHVLGTFALYSFEVRSPTVEEQMLIDLATHIAGIAIERKQAEDRIYYLAHHDTLTGLPNRATFRDLLSEAVVNARSSGHDVGIVYLDIDNFKKINDSMGHGAGDELLKEFASRLKRFARHGEHVVRLGGDEFVMILPGEEQTDPEFLPRLQTLRREIAVPLSIEGREIRVTSSIGVAIFPQDGDTPESVLAAADAAMYRSKQLGRNRLCFAADATFEAQPQTVDAREIDLSRAIEEEELFLEYQPRVDMLSGRILGLEALVRWNHPVQGVVPPLKFIPFAEESGLIEKLGAWVLRTACRQARAWQVAGLPPVVMAVNVSAIQFCATGFVRTVAGALQESGLAPEFLELELTEQTLLSDIEQAGIAMKALKALGVRLTVDDFGTGYSNLDLLRTFPMDLLKIDRSFIQALPHDAATRSIADAMISLARDLNLSIVAEGVETAAQSDYLQSQGCAQGQGFLFCAPIGAPDIERLLGQAC